MALPFANNYSEDVAWSRSLAMVVKLMMCSAFGIVFLYTPEYHALRSTDTSVCSAVVRIGTITTPFVVQLNYLSSYAPFCVFASSSFITCMFCFLFCVETNNKALPQTLADFYNLVHGKTA